MRNCSAGNAKIITLTTIASVISRDGKGRGKGKETGNRIKPMCLSLFDESMQPCRDSRGDSRCFVDSRAFVRRSHLWIIVTPVSRVKSHQYSIKKVNDIANISSYLKTFVISSS